MWKNIVTVEDLNELIDITEGFHDSCIKEICYCSGAYVDKDLNMHAVNDQRRLRLILQRQAARHSELELEFSGLEYLRLAPQNDDYTCEILDATLELRGDKVLWYDYEPLSDKQLKEYDGTLICAQKLRWKSKDIR